MPAMPLQRSSFVDEAYRALKQRIVSGEFGPGTALNIDALARELGVSNSPIREALRRLEYEQWVKTIPFRGAFVRRFDAAELTELYELREMLELAALDKIMSRPSAEGLERLSDALAEIHAALDRKDQVAYLTADTRFHQTIVDMAGNRRLSEVYATLIEQGRCFLLGRSLEDPAKCLKDRTEHDSLFEAVRSGGAALVKELLRDHLRFSLEEAREGAGREET